MKALNAIAQVLFLPGTIILRLLGISVEDDSGIFRSLLNSCFWGAIVLWVAIEFLL